MAENGIRLNLDLELIVNPDGKTTIGKFVTNDWPARLLLDVMKGVNEKVECYYSKSGDSEVCSVINTLTEEHLFSGSRKECEKFFNDHPKSGYLTIIP